MTLGDFDAGVTLHFKFTTQRPSTGAPFTLAGTPALSVYKDGGTTQSTAGITLTADFDGVTGLNHVTIDLSADGAFYAAGSQFDVVITTGTVDSVSAVGFVVGRFSIRKDSALKPTTAGRTLDVTAGGEAGIDWANIGSPTTAVNLSGTTVKTATDVEADTQDIQARLPAALVSGRIDASVGAMANNVMTAAAAAADLTTELQAGLATGADLATVAGYLDTEVAAILAAVDTEVAAIKAKTDNLPASPAATGDIPTAAAIADQVWDEVLSGHATAGSTGAALAAAGGSGDPWSTTLPGAYSAGTAGYIIGTNLNATVSSRLATSGYTAPLDAAGVRSAVGLASANLDTQLTAIDDYLDTEIAAIKAKTDNLPADPADASDIAASFTALSAKVDTIDDFLDTEIAAIKAQTDQLTFTGAGRVDANIEAINNDTTSADNLARSAATIVRGTVDTGASTTSIPTSSLSPAASVADQFKGRIVIFDKDTTTAALRGQATDITASSNTGTLTVTALTTAPASGDTFVIV